MIFQEHPDYSDYYEDDNNDIQIHQNNQETSNKAPVASAEESEENKLGSTLITYRFPEALQVVQLSLFSHGQCEAAFNKSMPKYLLCYNSSYSGGCSVSTEKFHSF